MLKKGKKHVWYMIHDDISIHTITIKDIQGQHLPSPGMGRSLLPVA